jgi:uncharacterized membrane protein YdjX (TVP38/TMEM64 family)
VTEPTPAAAPDAPPRARWVRLGLVVALFVALWVAAKTSGLLDDLDAEALRALVASWGAWGMVGYVALFAVAELAHVPGMIFVLAAMLAWGQVAGFAIGLTGAAVSVCTTFVVIRAVGGRALADVERPVVKRILARLDRRPIVTVAILRCVLWLAPFVNYALAMTNVRFRDYAIGSAIGLVPPVALAAVLFEWLLALVG